MVEKVKGALNKLQQYINRHSVPNETQLKKWLAASQKLFAQIKKDDAESSTIFFSFYHQLHINLKLSPSWRLLATRIIFLASGSAILEQDLTVDSMTEKLAAFYLAQVAQAQEQTPNSNQPLIQQPIQCYQAKIMLIRSSTEPGIITQLKSAEATLIRICQQYLPQERTLETPAIQQLIAILENCFDFHQSTSVHFEKHRFLICWTLGKIYLETSTSVEKTLPNYDKAAKWLALAAENPRYANHGDMPFLFEEHPGLAFKVQSILAEKTIKTQVASPPPRYPFWAENQARRLSTEETPRRQIAFKS